MSLPRTFGQSAPTFGTTVVIPAGLHGTVYLIPKDTTVLPDFQNSASASFGPIHSIFRPAIGAPAFQA
jgi:hypothetical protein